MGQQVTNNNPAPKPVRRKRATLGSTVANSTSQVSDFIKSKDLYGQAVNLTYRGEETFKTCPGGIISIVVLLILFLYSVLKIKYMIFKQEWQLIQQTVVADLDELSQPHDMGLQDYQNISLGLQFYPKKAKQTIKGMINALNSRDSEEEEDEDEGWDDWGDEEDDWGDEEGMEGYGDYGDYGGEEEDFGWGDMEEGEEDWGDYGDELSFGDASGSSSESSYSEAAAEDSSSEAAGDAASEATEDTSTDTSTDTSGDTSGETSGETSGDTSTDSSTDSSSGDSSSTDSSGDSSTTDSSGGSTDTSTDTSEDSSDSTDYSGYGARRRVQASTYETKVQELAKYLVVHGMFEKKQGNKYVPYGDKNADIYTWVRYNTSTLTPNDHGLLELRFNLTDATILGTENHKEKMTEVLSRYHVRVDQARLEEDAYAKCMADAECAGTINDSKAKITNELISKLYTNYAKLSAKKKAQRQTDAQRIWEMARSPNMSDHLSLLDNYYLQYLPATKASLENKRKSKERTLLKKYGQQFDSTATVESVHKLYVKYQSSLVKVQAASVAEIDQLSKEIWTFGNKTAKYKTNKSSFEAQFSASLEKFDLELVVYDEVEFFRKHEDTQFNYPYQKRKNKIKSYSFKVNSTLDGIQGYSYQREKLQFRQSFVCLEPSVFQQMLFVNELADELSKTATVNNSVVAVEKKPAEKKGEFCENEQYKKLKFQGYQTEQHNFLDHYEKGVIKDKILLEVMLQLDPFKTESLRTSTQILDLLGDLGGFYQALDLMVFMVAQFFSARFFLAKIAGDLYQVKKPQPKKKPDKHRRKGEETVDNIMEMSQMKGESIFSTPNNKRSNGINILDLDSTFRSADSKAHISNQFEDIRISTFNLVLDPFLQCLATPVTSCTKRAGCNKRQKILETCEEKLSDELEITSLLGKVRDCHGMLQFLTSSHQQHLLKYSKERVINLESGSSSEDSQQEDEASQSDSDLVKGTPQEESEQKTFVGQQLSQAIEYSIIRGSSFDADYKRKLLNNLTIDRINQRYIDELKAKQTTAKSNMLQETPCDTLLLSKSIMKIDRPETEAEPPEVLSDDKLEEKGLPEDIGFVPKKKKKKIKKLKLNQN